MEETAFQVKFLIKKVISSGLERFLDLLWLNFRNFASILMKPISELYPLLEEPRKVVITTHQKPDPDAMGSSLGLYHFLKTFGHEVTVISPTNWASWLNWMPGSDTVLDYESMQDKCKVALQE